MNKVYNCRHKDDGVYYAVGGKNKTDALLNYVREIGKNPSEFINCRATLAKNFDGIVIETEESGFIGMEVLMPKGYDTWWECEECGHEAIDSVAFDYVAIDRYKCRKCGFVGNIPFVY